MEKYATYDLNDPVTRFLVWATVAFVSVTLLLLGITVISRYRRIRAEKRKEILTREVEMLVSGYLFSAGNVEEPDGKYAANTLFTRMLLKTVILLHSQYSGEYATRLEHFYRKSGLLTLTLKRLQSGKWNERLESVRDLTEMNVAEMAEMIAPLCYDRSPLMRMEAMISIVRLQGIEALKMLADYPYPLTDWTQIHIIQALKNSKVTDVPDIGFLLDAKEYSSRVLGVRLVGMYGQQEQAKRLKDMLSRTTDPKIAATITETLAKLGPVAFNNQSDQK